MYQGNWKCNTCGGAITELPFEPRSELGLTCRTCYGKQKEKDNQQASEIPTTDDTSIPTEAPSDIPDYAEVAGEPAPDESYGTDTSPTTNERPKFSGDWSCADCKGPITSLPFEPRNTSNLKCLDCFKKSKG